MRIGVDARLAYYNREGIGRYVRELLRGFAESGSCHQFLVYQLKYDRSTLIEAPGITTRRVWSIPRRLCEGTILARDFRKQKLNVFHATDFFVPVRPIVPLVFSVHDLYFLKEPRAIDGGSLRHYRNLRKYVRNASVVMCCSESTRADLLSLTGIDAAKTRVIFYGIDAARYAGAPPKTAGRRFDLPDKLLLMVGTIEPRKNIERVLSAYSRILERGGKDIPPLVLAGKAGFRASEILAPACKAPLSGKVHVLGAVSDGELKHLYHSALALIYPSLYEGFGFPVLEAMASGVPVLTSGVSSLPEVGGDAALYADPLSVESIERLMEQLLENDDLRSDLIEKGRRRAALFPWRKTAESTLQVYEQAGGAI